MFAIPNGERLLDWDCEKISPNSNADWSRGNLLFTHSAIGECLIAAVKIRKIHGYFGGHACMRTWTLESINAFTREFILHENAARDLVVPICAVFTTLWNSTRCSSRHIFYRTEISQSQTCRGGYFTDISLFSEKFNESFDPCKDRHLNLPCNRVIV
jgi:hypothetical protein